MTRWEYTITSLYSETFLHKTLTEYGSEGWELVAIEVKRRGDMDPERTFYFKRPLPPEGDPHE